MKVKTFILTFLMMSCPFLFGQSHWVDPILPGEDVMTVTAKVTLDGTLQSGESYEVAVFNAEDNKLVEVGKFTNHGITELEYHVGLSIPGAAGDRFYFKFFNGTYEYVSLTEIDYVAQQGSHLNLFTIEFKSVAQIEGTEFDVVYPSLQKAIDAAANGNVVTLLENNEENVTVVQAPNVAFTINGAEKTMSGTITVNGKSAAYATAGLTIKNVNFDATNISKDASINLGDGKTTTRYTNGVTVENCDFTGDDQTKVAIKNYTGGCKNLTVTGGTFTGLHSLAQLKGVTGLTITGVIVEETGRGISVGTSTNVVISNSTFDVNSYGVRADGGAYEMTLTDNNISAELPVVVRNAEEFAYNLTIAGNNNNFTAKQQGNNPEGYQVVFTTGDDGTYLAPTTGQFVLSVPENFNVYPVYVAQVGNLKYTSVDAALTAAQPGDVVQIFAGTYNQALNINKAITVEGERNDQDENLVNITGKLNITANNATVKNLNVNNGGSSAGYINAEYVTVDGCKVVGSNGFRSCYTTGLVTFKNSTITGSTYGIHFDGSAGGNIVIDNCDITGWTSFASTITNVAISNTKFLDGNYNQLRFYQNATVENVIFPAGMRIDTGSGGTGMEGIDVRFNGCSIVGGDLEDAFPDSVIAKSDIYVDNVLLKREAKIGDTYYETLAEAFEAAQNGDEVKILAAGTYALSTSGKNITITGVVDGVVFDNIGAKNMGGANVTFNNVTFDYYPNVNYTGLQHSGNLVYNDCTFEGQPFLYGTSETFNNCTFNQNSADAYNVWTYGAKEVDFNECTFNSVGKSVLIYTESATTYNEVAVTKCTFNASSPVDGKAAIEMDSSLSAGINLTIDGETTATGFGSGNVSGNSLWNNKKGNNDMANNDITVVVNNVTVLKPWAPVAKIGETPYETLAKAISAATAGQTITICSDVNENVTINKNLTIDGGDNNYTGTMTGNAGLTVTVQNLNFVNAWFDKSTKSTTGTYVFRYCSFDGYNATQNYAFRFKGANSVTIENCTVKDYLYSFLYVTSSTATVNIKDVTVKDCPSYGVYFSSGVTNTSIENLTVENSNNGFVINNTANRTLNLKDCTFENVTTAINHSNGTNTVKCNLSGENDFGTSASSQYAKYVLSDVNATLTAPEGLNVTTSVVNYLVKYENGVYVVKPAVAKIDDTYYETLTEAINAADDGATIQLLPVTINEYVAPWITDTQHTSEKSITIVGSKDDEGKLATTLTAGMYLGYDDSQCREHTIVVKDVKFEGKGLKVACQQNVTIEGNQFNDITEGQAIAVVGKNIKSVVKNNVIDGVTTSNPGIELRNTLTATVEGNIISNTGHNALQITSQVDATASEINVINNTMSNWGTAQNAQGELEGRAMRISNIVTANINGNVMSHTAAPEEFVKVTGSTTLDASENYWNGESPLTDGMFTGVEGDLVPVLKSYYTDAEKQNLVVLSPSVAKIGEEYYPSLAAAVSAAQPGNTIELLKDITENVTVNKSVTIDGANDEAVGGKFDYTGTMTANAGLTVTVQNIDFVGGGFDKSTKSTSGNYTIKNCTFEDDGDYAYPVRIKGANSVTIEDCTVKNYLYSFLYITSGTNSVSVKNVTVEDCPSYAVYFASGVNTATIENLTVKNSNNGFVINNTANRALTLKNCKLENVGTAVAEANGTNTITCTLLGNENNFGTSASSQYAKYVLAESTATLTAPEGLNVTTSVPEYVVVYENGAYIVKAGNVLNANTDVKYATLADAITAATAGNTLVLLADITENVTVSKNLTIDGANDEAVGGKFDYTGTMTANAGLTVTVQNIDFVGGGFDKSTKSTTGNYTIKNCTFEDDGNYAYPVRFKGANSVTIEDCTVKNYLYSFLYITSGTNSVSVKNVTVEDCPNYAVYFASGVNSAIIENLTVKNSDNGFVINNTANRALTLKNCKLENVGTAVADANGTNTITCTLLGNGNDFGTSASSQYAKYVLAATDATLTAPEGFNVTTSVGNHTVKYVDGAYKVVPAVAKIDDVCYETLADAIAAIGEGDVTIVLLANASLDITAWQNLAIGGDNTTSITIDGDNGEEDFTLTFNKLNSDWNHVATSNGNTTKLILNNLKLADSGYNNGPWNRYDIVFASDVELTNVVSAKALAFKANATLNNVTINESGDNYAIWIQPNGQSVTIDGLVINSAGRGIKVDEQYVTAQNVSLSVANATFTTAKKAAIMVKSSAETTITVGEDVNIVNVAADQANIAWVDEDASAHYGKVTVTGGTLTQENLPVFVAALMNDAMVEGYYKVFEEALAAAANEKILVLKTVVFDTDKEIDFEGKEVNSNVHPVFRITNGATVTVKNGNMNTAKGYNFILGASDESSAGNLTIESGKFHGAITVASVTMGSLNITGGEFSVEPYQGSYEFLINCIDANYNNGAEVSISGGTFHKWNPENNAAEGANTNFCAPGHVAVYDAVNDTYTVIEADYVAQIGEVKYISLQAAIDAAVVNDVIVVLENINIADVELQKLDGKYNTYFKVEGKAVTIDLKGKTISGEYASSPMLVGVFSTDNTGHLTLEDSSDEKTGAVNVTTAEGYTVYSLIANYEPGCSITINGGTYTLDKASDSHIYSGSTSGETEGVTVNGGVFKLGNVGTGTNGKPWMFNVLGSNDGNVVVKGGTFDADINHQFWAKEVYVPETLALQNNGNGTWKVVESVAYVEETATSTGSTARKVGYATIEDAIEAIGIRNTNETVTMLKNVVLENTITIAAGKEVILDLNGKVVSMEDASAKGAYAIKNNGNLTIKDSAEGGKITFNSTTPDNSFGYATSTIGNGGHLTIENGLIENTTVGGASYAVDGIWHTGEASLTINDGKITATKIAVRQVPFSATAKNTVTINGGTLTGATAGLQMFNTSNSAMLSETNIYGGTFNGTYAFYTSFTSAQASELASISIDGGTFNGYVFLYNGQAGSEDYPMNVNINSGNFNAGVYVYTKDAEGNQVNIPSISGGVFTTAAKEDTDETLLNENFAFVDNGNGTWTVMPVQEQSLVKGWNWYSTYLDIELNDLTTALGDNGSYIKNSRGNYVENFSNNIWLGDNELTTISPSEMYLVQTTEECDLKLAADLVNPSEHIIKLNTGWSWIGYPSNQEGVAVGVALKNIDPKPKEGDLIKTLNNGYAEYAFGYWLGTLNTMVPGIGYKYHNTSGEVKTFYYNIETTTRGAVEANVTAENNYWTPNATKYPFNMTMTAVVDGLADGNYEVAAFVNGELRGSARPIYVEALDTYMFFLTIHGEDVEEMSFRLYDIDNDTEYDLSDRINYSNDAHLGSVNEPYVFSRGTTGIGEASMSEVNIYPNPTTTGTEINLEATCDKVEVFNALGVKVAEYQNVDTIDALETAGIYVIRITNDGNVQNCRLVVK